MTQDFFDKQTPSSWIKAKIVSEYFPSYSKIIVKKYTPRVVRYVDLFAGKGIYKDGNHSTPLLIGEECRRDEFLRTKTKLLFNDNEHGNELEANFLRHFPKGTFSNEPYFATRTVGEDARIQEFLLKNTHVGKNNESPTLLFIDPFGYKGIETRVLAQFMQNWGNELFLFVNTKRIHPALENDKFDSLMKDLFPTTLDEIRNDRRYGLNVSERLNLIIQSIGKEYQALLGGNVYYTAFKFQEEDSDATSHFILHITKHHRGFDLVKQIYNDFANVGTTFDGANTYTFDAKKMDDQVAELFDIKEYNIQILKDLLTGKYSGRTVSAIELFDEHQRETLYSRSHYSVALRALVDEGRLTTKFTDEKHHKVSVLISQDCIITFH